ncbi:MAG: transposase [Planctomycetota bacterium]|nr:transposase [Planctomycetota bacterium]
MDVASLVSAWDALVQHLCLAFTDPTARTWQQIALGWVLHRGPATVTGIFRTLGRLADRHWTVYQKFFYRAAWSLEMLSAYLMARVIGPMILESGQVDSVSGKPAADLAIDDTTAGRYGKHVAHAGWFKDASAQGPATKGTVIHWAHNWIVGVITLRLPRWPLVRWVLPAVFALYRKPPDCNKNHPFRTRQVLAGEMVQRVAKALPEVQLRVSADGQYATRDMVMRLPKGTNLVSRIRRDAAIYDLPPPRRAGQRGRPRKKGKRLPTPWRIALRRKSGWKEITALKQGQVTRRLVMGITCLWYHVCKDVPIRLVIVRDPIGRQKDDFFFCTDATVTEQQIVQRYYDRWGVEESILEAKQQMRFESTRGWCSRTVNRQAPLAMVLVTLVKAWYARCAAAEPSLLPESTPWYPSKTRPSFLDMLSALRRVLWHHRFFPKSGFSARVQEIWNAVCYTLSAAA